MGVCLDAFGIMVDCLYWFSGLLWMLQGVWVFRFWFGLWLICGGLLFVRGCYLGLLSIAVWCGVGIIWFLYPIWWFGWLVGALCWVFVGCGGLLLVDTGS